MTKTEAIITVITIIILCLGTLFAVVNAETYKLAFHQEENNLSEYQDSSLQLIAQYDSDLEKCQQDKN